MLKFIILFIPIMFIGFYLRTKFDMEYALPVLREKKYLSYLLAIAVIVMFLAIILFATNHSTAGFIFLLMILPVALYLNVTTYSEAFKNFIGQKPDEEININTYENEADLSLFSPEELKEMTEIGLKEVNNQNEQEVFGKIESEDSKLIVLCPSCGMKYGTKKNTNSQIEIRNFEDEDIKEQGQQISCLKCGQKFTVPQE